MHTVFILHDPDNNKLNTLVSHDMWKGIERYTMKILHIIFYILGVDN
jgi:hypothetical protein